MFFQILISVSNNGNTFQVYECIIYLNYKYVLQVCLITKNGVNKLH